MLQLYKRLVTTYAQDVHSATVQTRTVDGAEERGSAFLCMQKKTSSEYTIAYEAWSAPNKSGTIEAYYLNFGG